VDSALQIQMKCFQKKFSFSRGGTYLSLFIVIVEFQKCCSKDAEGRSSIDEGGQLNSCPGTRFPPCHSHCQVFDSKDFSDACRITDESNKPCADLPSLAAKQILNVSGICDAYLSDKFPTAGDCALRCNACTVEGIITPCSESLRKKKNRRKYGENKVKLKLK